MTRANYALCRRPLYRKVVRTSPLQLPAEVTINQIVARPVLSGEHWAPLFESFSASIIENEENY